MKKHIMQTVLSLLIVCMFTGCGEGEPKTSQEVTMEISTTEESLTEEASQEEQDLEEPSASEEPEIPELTEWDGTGELKKLNQRELGEYQYIGGKAYFAELPLVERTTGKYPGEARCEFFYMTDDTLFYMEDDETVSGPPHKAKSTYLFAQPLQSNGDDVVLLDEKVYAAVYQDGIIITMTYDGVYKRIEASTGKILYEYDCKKIDGKGFNWEYTDKYVLYHTADGEKIFYFDGQEERDIYIPSQYKDALWVWSGNIFSKQYNEDGTSNIIQLYEQCEPVWRIFPQKMPVDFDFSDGKAFYYDEETGVMEYDLETNRLRHVCDVEPDEYEGERRGYLEAVGDNGGVFLIEMNSYNLYPNTFYYFIDEEGNKELIGKDFSS